MVPETIVLRWALHDELAPRVLSLASGENPGTEVWIWQDKRARSDDESVDKVVLLPKTFFLFTERFDGGCTSPDFVNTDNFYYPTSGAPPAHILVKFTF